MTASGQGGAGRRMETGADGTRNASEGGGSAFDADQNCRSIDSHMSRLRLPRYLRDLAHLETEADPDPTSRASSPGSQ